MKVSVQRPSRQPPSTGCTVKRASNRAFLRPVNGPFIALAPGSIFVRAQLPPLWRDYDSLLQINNPPGHNNLLQFPALYPFVSRLPVLFVSGLHWLRHDRPLHIDANASVALNDSGIYLLILAQHLSFAPPGRIQR